MHCETITIIYVISLSVTPKASSEQCFSICYQQLSTAPVTDQVNQYSSVQETYATLYFFRTRLSLDFELNAVLALYFILEFYHIYLIILERQYMNKVSLFCYLSQGPTPIYFISLIVS